MCRDKDPVRHVSSRRKCEFFNHQNIIIMKHMLLKLIVPIMAIALMTACEKESFSDDLTRERATPVDVRASDFNFTASLAGYNEVPPTNSNAAGECIVRIAKDESSIYYKLIAANIDDVTASHFHMAPEGVNGGVVAFLFSGPQPGPQNGILAEGTITAADVINALEGDLDALIDAIREGNIYVNVHTTANPGGEIRGQVD
jgi:hypothetical protein